MNRRQFVATLAVLIPMVAVARRAEAASFTGTWRYVASHKQWEFWRDNRRQVVMTGWTQLPTNREVLQFDVDPIISRRGIAQRDLQGVTDAQARWHSAHQRTQVAEPVRFGIEGHQVRITSGQCSANDSEMDEGYLAIAQETAIHSKPKSVVHDILRTLRHRVIDLWAEVRG